MRNMTRHLSYLYPEINLVKSLLKKQNGNCHCGLCISVFFDRYVQRFFSENEFNELSKKNNMRKKQLRFRDLDLIRKGQALERLIHEVKQIDPFDEVNPWMLSGIAKYLETFFNKKYLEKEFKDTYLNSILLSIEKKKLWRKQEIRQKEARQRAVHKLQKLEREIKKNLKKQNKIDNDIKRTKFLFMFNKLNPIEKLKVILNGADVPLQAVPEIDLPKPSLLLRYLLKKEFNPTQLAALRDRFGENFKNNKISSWKKLIKVMK